MRVDPILHAFHTAAMSDVGSLGRITAREKVFIELTALTCQSVLGAPFEALLARAADDGVTREDLRDAVRFIAYDAGYHVCQTTMARLDALSPPPAEVDPARIAEIAATAARTDHPLPDFVRARLDDLGESFTQYMARESRLRQTSSLSVRGRSFMTMTVDALYQTLDDTFRMHVRRALNAGADRETLREVLVYGALFGGTRAWNALRALESAVPS